MLLRSFIAFTLVAGLTACAGTAPAEPLTERAAAPTAVGPDGLELSTAPTDTVDAAPLPAPEDE